MIRFVGLPLGAEAACTDAAGEFKILLIVFGWKSRGLQVAILVHTEILDLMSWLQALIMLDPSR